jgi:endogenous inhibitor of DNA gyrase (YacG/DUF329 family)
MPGKKSRLLRCPTCRKIVATSDENFPFCSDRCRLIDLGKWASGGYVISTPITDPEMLESLVKETEKKPEEDELGKTHRGS